MRERTFGIGDRVSVPWGLDVLEGTVLNVYGADDEEKIEVEVHLPGEEDDAAPVTVTLPARVLKQAEAAADERRPGQWLTAARYEADLGQALETVLGRTLTTAEQRRRRSTGREVDFLIEAPGRTLIVEAKASESRLVSRAAIEQLLHYVRDQPEASRLIVGLLITNSDLSQPARERLRQAVLEGATLLAVKWRSVDDNAALQKAVQDALSA